ncbi:hypothetical protein HDU76_007884 [Blyttiomyces sp. JEL0837]|nr:hypothetical protein HDU76_007884 [Blyttiomyces sp. JEL0837]
MVVTIDYKDVMNKSTDLSDAIAKGFGSDGGCLGIVVIKGLEETGFIEKRGRLLQLASKFADLPENVKEAVTHPQSSYLFGWSHGKEFMEGKPDFAKGSYYNNPVRDIPPVPTQDYCEKYPQYGFPNVWPKELPELRDAFLELGTLITQIGLALAKKCDQYVAQIDPDLPGNLIANAVENSITHKARLLHYFPMTEDEVKKAEDGSKKGSWCGMHVDHSMLTGLTSAYYLDSQDKSYKEIAGEESCETAGLFIKTRDDELCKVNIPKDCIAFQLGEAAQVGSRNLLIATPHFVRGGAAPNVARNTFAVFLQPNVDYKLTPDMTFNDLTVEVMKRHY